MVKFNVLTWEMKKKSCRTKRSKTNNGKEKTCMMDWSKPKGYENKKTMTHKTYFIVNQYHHLKVLIHVRYNNPLVMNFDDNFPQLFTLIYVFN